MIIRWDEERFGTGFPDIDAQHKELFDRINRLTESLERDPHAKIEAGNLLYFLEEYVHEHFGCEESLMVERRCEACPRNKAEHERFLKTFRTLRLMFEREGVSAEFVERIQKEVVDWIQGHVAGVDTGLRSVAP